jgi:predicted DCC family thiol-disulfide oxidoreductase YuxK
MPRDPSRPSTATASKARALIPYDSQCPQCRRSVRLLKWLDWQQRLEFIDGGDETNLKGLSPFLPASPSIREMHLITPDRAEVHRGFKALRWLAWRLPLLVPLAPFLSLPGIGRLGQRLKAWAALDRWHLVPCHERPSRLPWSYRLASRNGQHQAVTGPSGGSGRFGSGRR